MASRSSRPTAPRPAGADGYGPVFWTAFTRSANPMVLVDLDRRIVAANQAGAAVAGRPAEALAGTPLANLLDDPAEAVDDERWRELVLAGESFGHRRIRRPDGTTRIVDFAMRATRVGGRVLVLGVCLHERSGDMPDRPHDPAPLTAREREITHLIAIGCVTGEICAELHIAPDTVRAHVRNAMAKTGARTRAQLVAIAMGEGLLEV